MTKEDIREFALGLEEFLNEEVFLFEPDWELVKDLVKDNREHLNSEYDLKRAAAARIAADLQKFLLPRMKATVAAHKEDWEKISKEIATEAVALLSTLTSADIEK